MGVVTLEGTCLNLLVLFVASTDVVYLDIIEVKFFCFSASGNLADALKEIISEEIVDETDRYEDNQSKRRAKRLTTSAVMRG